MCFYRFNPHCANNISSPWIWKGVSATLSSGRYTLSYPRWRYVFCCHIGYGQDFAFSVQSFFYSIYAVSRDKLWYFNFNRYIAIFVFQYTLKRYFRSLKVHDIITIIIKEYSTAVIYIHQYIFSNIKKIKNLRQEVLLVRFSPNVHKLGIHSFDINTTVIAETDLGF